MPQPDLPSLLIQKAEQDCYVLKQMAGDAEAPVEIFGFHSQQATEKLIKATLSFKGVIYRRTHQLTELADLAIDNGIQFPSVVESLVDLTPYAVEFRYDVFPNEGYEELDKPSVLEQVNTFYEWTCTFVNYIKSKN